jgi:hypothetical protein
MVRLGRVGMKAEKSACEQLLWKPNEPSEGLMFHSASARCCVVGNCGEPVIAEVYDHD